MTATIKTHSATNVNTASAIDTLSRVSLISMGVASSLIGLWATACMVGAVMSNGIGGVVSGFVSALVG
jgi:tetrahydromethanopterin S-methyltransferase subunit F